MEISCCKLFTPTIWVMYAFGSVGCVGSWFWSSLTSSVRKSLAVMSPELLDDELAEVFAELLAVLPAVLPPSAVATLLPLTPCEVSIGADRCSGAAAKVPAAIAK